MPRVVPIGVQDFEQYNTISFDIFNTILFREYPESEQLFTAFGEYIREKGLLKVDLSGGGFAKVREAAENEARKAVRKNGGIETITQIYQHFPALLMVQPDVLADMELEFEKQHAYLNLDMIQLLQYCRRKGKKIYLISDMYFTKEQITSLLTAIDFDWDLVDGLYVSADYQADKISGRLYEVVKECNELDTAKWLHVGDDLIADVYGAQKQKIHSYHYDIDAWCNETLMHENIFGGNYIHRYRKLRGLHGISNDSSDLLQQAYKIGWVVFGPVLSYFTEWILKIARENQIRHIYPLMREGVLITKLLNAALDKKNITDIKVKPLYVSRKVTMFAKYTKLNEPCFDMLMEQEQTTIKDLLNMLGLESEKQVFTEWLEVMLNDLELPQYKNNKGISLKEQLKEILFKSENKEKIDSLIRHNNELLYQYLHSEIDLAQDFITCDVGYRGRIQTGMNFILQQQGYTGHPIHTLLFGVEETLKNYMLNVDIRGCLGNFGINQKVSEQLIQYYYLLEGIFMDDTGSTDSYCLDRVIVPILSERKVSEKELEVIGQIQRGIIEYYQYYMEYQKRYPGVLSMNFDDVQTRNEYSRILLRIFTYPDSTEAEVLLNITYEMNVGSTYHNVMDYNTYKSIIETEGIARFMRMRFRNKQVWKEGVVKKYDPKYQLTNEIDKLEFPYKYFADMFRLCLLLQEKGYPEIIVYGAGVVGHTLYQAAKYFNISIGCFIDRNPELWELRIGKSGITSIDSSLVGKYHCPIVIASYAYLDEIVDSIRNKGIENLVYSVNDI